MKLLIGALVTVAAVLTVWWSRPAVVVLHAQTLPITKTLVWDASVPTEQVTNYVVKLDGVTIGSPTSPSQVFTITSPGPHTLSVSAVNPWGSSTDATLAINVVLPSRPNNLRVTP